MQRIGIIIPKIVDGSSLQLRALHDTIMNSMSTLKNLETWHHSMLHKHPESTAPVVAIATRDQPLQPQ